MLNVNQRRTMLNWIKPLCSYTAIRKWAAGKVGAISSNTDGCMCERNQIVCV